MKRQPDGRLDAQGRIWLTAEQWNAQVRDNVLWDHPEYAWEDKDEAAPSPKAEGGG